MDQLEVDSMVAFFWLQHSADRAIRICTQVGGLETQENVGSVEEVAGVLFSCCVSLLLESLTPFWAY